jgi:CDP-glucose 4,6-dehydratase
MHHGKYGIKLASDAYVMNPLEAYYKNKQVLITGHTGFKGSWLCEWLLELGANVTGASLPPNTTPSLFEQLQLQKRVKHHIVDIRDSDEIITLIEDI